MIPPPSTANLSTRLRYTLWILRLRVREAPSQIRQRGSLRAWFFYLPGPGPFLMSFLRKRWVMWRNPNANIIFDGPVYLGPRFSLDMPNGGTFRVGPGTEFRRGFRAELAHADSQIIIGGACAFTYDVIIQCATSIEIGDHVMFGQTTLVVDGNHRFRDLDKPMLEQGYIYKSLKIANHVTTTTKCTIIANIGERTFVGANSVVSRDLPAFCLAAGAPARVLDYFGPPGGEPEGYVPSSREA